MNEKNVLNGEKRKKYINDVVVSLKTCRQLRNKDKKSGTNIDYKTKKQKRTEGRQSRKEARSNPFNCGCMNSLELVAINICQ